MTSNCCLARSKSSPAINPKKRLTNWGGCYVSLAKALLTDAAQPHSVPRRLRLNNCSVP